jgi:3'-phosphoadenosine 5'-phosphosulfate sulfotransferase (PAPS reductase)/FAD synthetase
MLNHSPIGPLPDGSYSVGYPTPGCSVLTVVSAGMTKERAQAEAARLNEEQQKKAAAIERDRHLRMRPRQTAVEMSCEETQESLPTGIVE